MFPNLVTFNRNGECCRPKFISTPSIRSSSFSNYIPPPSFSRNLIFPEKESWSQKKDKSRTRRSYGFVAEENYVWDRSKQRCDTSTAVSFDKGHEPSSTRIKDIIPGISITVDNRQIRDSMQTRRGRAFIVGNRFLPPSWRDFVHRSSCRGNVSPLPRAYANGGRQICTVGTKRDCNRTTCRPTPPGGPCRSSFAPAISWLFMRTRFRRNRIKISFKTWTALERAA